MVTLSVILLLSLIDEPTKFKETHHFYHRWGLSNPTSQPKKKGGCLIAIWLSYKWQNLSCFCTCTMAKIYLTIMPFGNWESTNNWSCRKRHWGHSEHWTMGKGKIADYLLMTTPNSQKKRRTAPSFWDGGSKTHMDKNFRVKLTGNLLSIGGSSMGGLISLMGFTQPCFCNMMIFRSKYMDFRTGIQTTTHFNPSGFTKIYLYPEDKKAT